MKLKFSEKLAKIEGSWKQIESHGLDEFLSASGIGWMKRKMATKCNPVDQIQISGENLTISYTGRTRLINFPWLRDPYSRRRDFRIKHVQDRWKCQDQELLGRRGRCWMRHWGRREDRAYHERRIAWWSQNYASYQRRKTSCWTGLIQF